MALIKYLGYVFADLSDMDQMKALLSELKVLIHVGQHLNIVNLLGAYTRDIRKGKPHRGSLHLRPIHTKRNQKQKQKRSKKKWQKSGGNRFRFHFRAVWMDP